ncbi:MAG: multiheme c-type cytochrome [Planctomycetota bacterium]
MTWICLQSNRATLCFVVASLVLGPLVFGLGCSPPPPEVADVELRIGDPDADPGQITDGPISPPELHDLSAGTPAQAATMRRDGTQLVQQTGAALTEEVPTPDPDKENPAEVVPTPDGQPVVEGDGQGPEDYKTWPKPPVTLVVTGNQHGYIEPCGCTGLDRQKGGLARRYTFMKQLEEMGWDLLPIDAGNQVRRYGRQAEIKLQQTSKALQQMDYRAVGFGPDDLRLGVGELLAVAAADDPESALYVSANVVLIDESLMPSNKVVSLNGAKIGVTSILDPEALEVETSEEIVIKPIVESARREANDLIDKKTNFRVLMFYGEEDAAEDLVREVQGFNLVVVAGGYGEPTYRAEKIEGSKTRMIVTGNKGMYAGLVGLYPTGSMRYARVPLTHEFEDAPEMRLVMREYQDQLRDIGLEGLGLLPPIPHASGQSFVGSAKCGECHTKAYEVWEFTAHVDATDHIVKPPLERGDIGRHFDPECLSCHVTGWNAQEYYPYQSGYLSLDGFKHLHGNGCENCHGPGSEHSAAEAKDSTVSAEIRGQLRDAMKVSLENAKEMCMKCHDLDNSPDFHEPNAFEEDYWPSVEHYGKD